LKNYKLLIQYDGTDYAGWQSQSNAVSVQHVITGAIELILNSKITLTGSGRTDSGVHALGQTANFRFDGDLDFYKFKYQLNSILPADIAIRNIEEVSVDFHSRFDARKRSYLYLISRDKSPFLKKYSWFINRDLDVDRFNQLGRLFLGRKDFTAFCKSSSETQNKICEIYSISWRRIKAGVVFYIEADRFLHGMVRTIIGTLIRGADNPFPEDYINDIFRKNRRAEAGESVPALGLFLYKVKYDN
jgi:tRNA pseudouridine38-40 synthase